MTSHYFQITTHAYKVSRAPVKTAVLLFAIGLGISTQSACGPVISAGRVVIDCVKANQSEIGSALLKLEAAPSWAAVEASAIALGETIGGCALVALVDQHSFPKGMERVVGGTSGPATLERVRASFGGVTWQTASGPR
jgi:hypothetical protein